MKDKSISQQDEHFLKLKNILEVGKQIIVDAQNAIFIYIKIFRDDICGQDRKTDYIYKARFQKIQIFNKELSKYSDFFKFHLQSLTEILESKDINKASIEIKDDTGPFANIKFSNILNNLSALIEETKQQAFESLEFANIEYCKQLPSAYQETLNIDGTKQTSQSKTILNSSFVSNIDVNPENVLNKVFYPVVDNRPKEAINSIYQNIHFDVIIKYSALNFFNKKENTKIVFSMNNVINSKGKKIGGFSDQYGNVALQLSKNIKWTKATLIHELSHSIFRIYNNGKSANPYSNKQEEELFNRAMEDSMANLYRLFVPGKALPSTIQEIAQKLKEASNNLTSEEQQIIATISTDLFLESSYEPYSYHAEYVVRFNEIIAHFDDLPPHIREALEPIEIEYKYRITPNIYEKILSNPLRAQIIENNYEKFFPETILNLSGEDYLFYKRDKQEQLTDEENNLLTQIEEMQTLIANGNVDLVSNQLKDISDERVIRASLTESIKLAKKDLFDQILKYIKAPEYLGPQLVLATKNKLNSIAKKLLIAIDEEPSAQYYIAKAAKFALAHDDVDLLSDLVNKIKDAWFLNNIFKIMIDFDKSEHLKSIIITKIFKNVGGVYAYLKNTPECLEILSNPLTKNLAGNHPQKLKTILEYVKDGKKSVVLDILSYNLSTRHKG